MQHLIGYDLARALHIIAVMAWIAGLLMLPRFYAYIASSEIGGELERTMVKASSNLRSIILVPSLVLSWAFGVFLFSTYLVSDWSRPLPDVLANVPHWFWLKFVFVLGLSGYQGFLFAEGRRLAQGQRRHSERFWRLMSEVPFLVAIVAILLATLEPR